MNLYKKIPLNRQEFIYDLDPNVIFNYTKDQFEYIYSRNQREITETVTAKQLNSKLEVCTFKGRADFIILTENCCSWPFNPFYAVEIRGKSPY